eukprot:5252330-Pyramimonas_sp.AAC.1
MRAVIWAPLVNPDIPCVVLPARKAPTDGPRAVRAVSAREATTDVPPTGLPVSLMAAQPVTTGWRI